MLASAECVHELHLEPTVFVVDDDVSVRESLELLIRHAGWRPRVFASAQAFLAHPRIDAPRCLVLDITLPDRNGLDVQKSIAVDQPSMPIIFITGYGDVPKIVQAMRGGAFDFLTKPFAEDVLLGAIRSAIDRSRTALREEADLHFLRACYGSLTQREREVLELVVSGRLNKQIGDELGISVITVKAHRGSVMRKMTADSVADLVKVHAKLGLASVLGSRTSATARPAGIKPQTRVAETIGRPGSSSAARIVAQPFLLGRR